MITRYVKRKALPEP